MEKNVVLGWFLVMGIILTLVFAPVVAQIFVWGGGIILIGVLWGERTK